MRAVILASGRSQRLQPVPDKILLEFCGQTLLEQQVQQLVNQGIDELVMIYGDHNSESIQQIADKLTLKPKLVAQADLELGMAGAVQSLAHQYKDNKPFLLVSSNDLIADTGLAALKSAIDANVSTSYLLAKEVSEYFPGGYLKIDADKKINTIIEKPGENNEPSNLVNLVYHYHHNPKALFAKVDASVKNGSANDDLYEQALDALFQTENYYAIGSSGPWFTIKYPWHIYPMAKHIFSRYEPKIDPDAQIAATAVIEGPVIICKGVKVLHNAMIKGPAYIGPNTIIANNSLVRDSFIGANCVIGFNSEIARSYIQNDVWTHTNYVGDSVIGNNVSFGAGSVTGNLRLDEEVISMNVQGEKIDTKLIKLGTVTGNNIRIGVGTCLMPGITIGSDCMIGSNLTIDQDIPNNSFVKGENTLAIKENTKTISVRNLN